MRAPRIGVAMFGNNLVESGLSIEGEDRAPFPEHVADRDGFEDALILGRGRGFAVLFDLCLRNHPGICPGLHRPHPARSGIRPGDSDGNQAIARAAYSC